MGRKRNQGKARKAAKAKAREEAEENGGNNNQTANGQQSLALALASQIQRLQAGALISPSQQLSSTECTHGFEQLCLSKAGEDCRQFLAAFTDAYWCEADKGDVDVAACLLAAEDATMDKFEEVWKDSAKMKIAISMLLCIGTQNILAGKYVSVRYYATYVRYMEQHIAVELKKTQALIHWPKIYEIFLSDDFNPSDFHTLIKFYRRRISCSCLDDKYEEVKDATKIGVCYNLECKIPAGKVERSRTMYCSRCRCVTYCSPECQKADWKLHRSACDNNAAIKAKFDAKQQNT